MTASSNTPIVIEKSKKFKALRPSQIVNMQRVIYDFEGKFKESFGSPERIGKWYITGPSFSGKSSLVFQVCKYMTQFTKVLYNGFEEKHAATVSNKILQFDMLAHEDRFKVVNGEPLELYKKRLLGKGGAHFGVIDSVQHGRINKKMYDAFVNDVCNPRRGRGMVFVNHWKKDDLTLHIKHDCDIKIEVIGYVAHVDSRFGGCKPFVIWEGDSERGAIAYWGKKYKKVIAGKYWPGQIG